MGSRHHREMLAAKIRASQPAPQADPGPRAIADVYAAMAAEPFRDWRTSIPESLPDSTPTFLEIASREA